MKVNDVRNKDVSRTETEDPIRGTTMSLIQIPGILMVNQSKLEQNPLKITELQSSKRNTSFK